MPGVDLSGEYELEQVWQVRAAVRRAALDADVLPEELVDGQAPVGQADETDVAADPDRARCLEPGPLRTDALEHAVGPDPVGERFDGLDACLVALDDDVRRAERRGDLLAGLVTAHGDDDGSAELYGGEDGAQTDRTVTDDRDACSGRRRRRRPRAIPYTSRRTA
jgi:hypothetical protein